jgi:argininosuccinate lyase
VSAVPSKTKDPDFHLVRADPGRLGAAHGVVRQIVLYCQSKGVRFEQLSIEELRRFHPEFDRTALALLSPEKVVQAKTSYGGTSPASVQRQMEKLRRSLR